MTTWTGPFGSTEDWAFSRLQPAAPRIIPAVRHPLMIRQRRKSNIKPQTPDFESRANGHACGAFKFAPADPRAFDRAQNRFPDAITQHWPVNQPHRKNSPRARDWFLFQNAS